MSWEESKAATPLKRDFIKAFFDRDQSFYLTGGSALGIFYLEHRMSNDLDFFTSEKVNWHLLTNTVVDVCHDIGAEYETLSASPQFYRFKVTRLPYREVVDFVIERVPQIDEDKETFGNVRVDTLKEILVNKICMLVSRCEIKDLVDLYFLEKKGFELSRYIMEARRKEAGLDPAMISFLLSQTRIAVTPDYLIEPIELSELESLVRKLQKTFAEVSFPEE